MFLGSNEPAGFVINIPIEIVFNIVGPNTLSLKCSITFKTFT